MKVCFATSHTFSQPGGVKNHILELSQEFKKRDIEVKIIVPRRNREENYGPEVILLGKSLPFYSGGSQGDICFTLNPKEIRKIMEKEKFDVVHFHNFVVPLAWQILNRSRSLNVLTFHSNTEALPFLKFLLPPFSYFLNKLDGIIGVAPLTLDYFPHFKGRKTLIPNGINLKEFNPNNPVIEKYKDGKINLLFVGRIEERKGLIYLLRAFKIIREKHENVRLIVVGDGPLKKECRDYVLENKLEDVVFEGQKVGKETASYFNTCDIYISPAPFGESFGIVLLEAMASQKPAVGFANKGYYELLKGIEGEKLLVPPRDIDALAQKIESLIIDEDLRRKMGEWGLKHAEKYSWEKVADQILDFYKSLN